MVLTDEQKDAVGCNAHAVVTACPGSGKTRVLTARILRGIEELTSTKQRVIGLTFTNRAADEIQHRLDGLGVATERLWAGTIHSFALEWILRPYAPYAPELRHGFTIADEHHAMRLMDGARRAHSKDPYLEVRTSWSRDGTHSNNGLASRIFDDYKASLRKDKLLDYDDVLWIAYRILGNNREICATLGAIMPLICVDEAQDIQDMQYAILSQIVRGPSSSSVLFFVGDSNQSIYEGLGALTKTPAEIAVEFGLAKIEHHELSENFRSTQRIVDYFVRIRPQPKPIKAKASYANEKGEIRFFNQTVHRDGLPKLIAGVIAQALETGVASSDICVIAPRWQHVRPLARALMANLPEVDFDAPGLSPLHSNKDELWFKLARLFLTGSRPGYDRTRQRWANDFIASFERTTSTELPESLRDSRGLLRFVNATNSAETDGLKFLNGVFGEFLAAAQMDLSLHPVLENSYANFFERSERNITDSGNGMPTTVEGLRKLFRSPAGVVVNTCHGVKGEEFHTVIALGLLRGYVPHWEVIMHGRPEDAHEQASKLLYVVCSRAKQSLFLLAESGRVTTRGRPYETMAILQDLQYGYDT